MEGIPFLAFVRKSPLIDLTSVETFHLFSRDGFWTFHNEQAKWVAQQLYSEEKGVLKKECEGLTTVNCYKVVCGRICASLIAQNKRIMLWHKSGAAWEADDLEASPGNTAPLEAELGTYFSKSASAETLQAVIASIWVDPLTYRVGAAIAHTTFGLLTLYDFVDDADWSGSASLLARHGVREVLVLEDKDASAGDKDAAEDKAPAKKKARTGSSAAAKRVYTGPLLAALQRAAVAITPLPRASFVSRNGGFWTAAADSGGQAASLRDTFVTELRQLAGKDADSQEHDVNISAAESMPLAHHAFRGLSEHLTLGAERAYELAIGSLDSVLAYDASVSHALGIFPEAGGHAGSGGKAMDLQDWRGDEGGGEVEDDGMAEDNPSSSSSSSSSSSGSKASRAAATADTLFGLINHAKTKMGGRLLCRWLQQPSRDLAAIRARHFIVGKLVSDPVTRSALRDSTATLLRFPDVEKIAQKFARRDNAPIKASLSDLLHIYRAVVRMQACVKAIGEADWAGKSDGAAAEKALGPASEAVPVAAPAAAPAAAAATPAAAAAAAALPLEEKLQRCCQSLARLLALVEELVDADALASTSSSRDARHALWHQKFVQVKPAFSSDLQRLHASLQQTQHQIVEEQARVAKVAGADSKAVHLERNAVQGLHLRVTKKDAPKIIKALDKEGVRTLSVQKQGTLFVTEKMAKLVRTHDGLRSEYDSVQGSIVQQALAVAATYLPVMLRASGLVAELDCLCCLAHVASVWDWCCPEMVAAEAEGGGLCIKGLRHPIVESIVGPSRYIRSDCDLRGKSTAVITGPNMGGKSTYIRAVGLAVLLAHMGSYVPADEAQIPLCDRILARVGASDSLVSGVSTFMAEMVDIAKILKRATPHSLVITDEIGRGTSASDGFGIAWATIERLATKIRCLSLFATHYHEICSMADDHDSVMNLHVSAAIESQGGKITMLYAVEPGPSLRSYGVACAKLARFPAQIVENAGRLVEEMEMEQEA